MPVKLTDWLMPVAIVLCLGLLVLWAVGGKNPAEPFQSWSRALRLNTCRDGKFGEIGAVLMPAGAADPMPWFDYSHQYWDGRGPRSCDDCPGPEICPTCHNHGVSLETGRAPPGPLALGADPAVYEYLAGAQSIPGMQEVEDPNWSYMSTDPARNRIEGYAAHILGAGAISGIIGGVSNAITTEVIYNYRKIADTAKSVVNIVVSPLRGTPSESMTVGSDGGYVRGYGNICYGAPDDASPAAVASMISPAVRASSIGGVNQANNVGYTVMNALGSTVEGLSGEYTNEPNSQSEPGPNYYKRAVGGLEYDTSQNYSSELSPDFTTSREAMGACTTRRPLSSSLPRTTAGYNAVDMFDAMAEDAADATVERSLRSGACNTVGKGVCSLGFISRGTGNARRPELDRTLGHLRDSAIDYLYKKATQMGLADPHPAGDDCTFWGAYGRPYYEQC